MDAQEYEELYGRPPRFVQGIDGCVRDRSTQDSQPEPRHRATPEGEQAEPAPDTPGEQKGVLIMLVVVVAVAVGVGFHVHGEVKRHSPDTTTASAGRPDNAEVSAAGDAPQPTRADSGAMMACSHFRNILGDVESGVLTHDEAREKLREVDDSAAVSDTPGIAEGARALLGAFTQYDIDGIAIHSSRLQESCMAAGA